MIRFAPRYCKTCGNTIFGNYFKVLENLFSSFEDDNEILCRMKTYTTFMLVRHPFERLVSAYYDKLTNQSTYDYYRKHVGSVWAKKQAPSHLRGIKPR